ncbi:MAG TPA: hypothetical protein VLD37_04065 [Candidatus Bilamarchaeum sp.]|nr:hypothetical protein [Candidatus Bilamarchaeum sp.]
MDFNFIERKEFKILVLLVIPFLYGLVLPHKELIVSGGAGSPGEGGLQNDTSLDYNSVQVETVPGEVNSVFALGKYLSFWPLVSFSDPEICFEDNGSYVAYPNGTKITAAIIWNITVGNRSIELQQGQRACEAVAFGHNVSYRWVGKLFFLVETNESAGGVKVVPQTSTYHRFGYDYGILQGIALIPAFYLLFWYPLIGILKKIDKGWKEQ